MAAQATDAGFLSKGISELIRDLRRVFDMTQDDLAQSMGVRPQNVSQWERGRVPTLETLYRMASAFGIPFADFLVAAVDVSRRVLNEAEIDKVQSAVALLDRAQRELEQCDTTSREVLASRELVRLALKDLQSLVDDLEQHVIPRLYGRA